MNRERFTAKEIKEILQLYETIARLKVLNDKIVKSNYDAVKKEIKSLESENNINKKVKNLEECLMKTIEIQEENKKNIQTYNETVTKILNVYEKVLFSSN